MNNLTNSVYKLSVSIQKYEILRKNLRKYVQNWYTLYTENYKTSLRKTEEYQKK